LFEARIAEDVLAFGELSRFVKDAVAYGTEMILLDVFLRVVILPLHLIFYLNEQASIQLKFIQVKYNFLMDSDQT
jgi:hypothetical protein